MRSRIEILSEILDICAEGSTKKKIITEANLNWNSANKYIEFLVKHGFVEFEEVFILTEKGRELNERLKSLQNSVL
ncbi:MAG: winged helix-turn-helix domain-containing protein [Archaeoglobaceae archaeon]